MQLIYSAMYLLDPVTNMCINTGDFDSLSMSDNKPLRAMLLDLQVQSVNAPQDKYRGLYLPTGW